MSLSNDIIASVEGGDQDFTNAQNWQLGGEITFNNDNFYLQKYRLDKLKLPLIKAQTYGHGTRKYWPQ